MVQKSTTYKKFKVGDFLFYLFKCVLSKTFTF